MFGTGRWVLSATIIIRLEEGQVSQYWYRIDMIVLSYDINMPLHMQQHVCAAIVKTNLSKTAAKSSITCVLGIITFLSRH